MGQLKPGATYIYERADGVTYARELGSTERTAVGWDFKDKHTMAPYIYWRDVMAEAEVNPTLQKAVDRVILLYKLSKEKYE